MRSMVWRLAFLVSLPASAGAQVIIEDRIIPVDLPIGFSYPIQTIVPITHVSVANPDVADVVLIDDRSLVVNGHGNGETDVIVWQAAARQHYRMIVRDPADRKQIVVSVKFAEVNRTAMHDFGLSGRYLPQSGKVRAGQGIFNTDSPFDTTASGVPNGKITIPNPVDFFTALTNFGTKDLIGFLQFQEQKGDARILAEPHVMAANNEPASFLAGGELPIPVAQATTSGVPVVTITYREFGIRLSFTGEIVSDSLIKLKLRPEVSTLDYNNAVTLNGFRIPALKTRRMETTIDVRRDRSLVLSGMFDDERNKVRTGIPLLMNIPILGLLFSSSNWQKNVTELVVIITPVVIDPLHPRAQDGVTVTPDTALPARDVLDGRLVAPAVKPPVH
jgi:pilus assembly protein CpaC